MKMKLRCLFGLHNWEYVQTAIRMPGGLRRMCLRCVKPKYHEGERTVKHKWSLLGGGGGWEVWQCVTCRRKAVPVFFGLFWSFPRCRA